MAEDVETTLAPDLHAAPAVTEAQRRRSMAFVCMAVGCMGFAMSIQMGLNQNFVAQELGLSGAQAGGLEACRETCGMLALGVLALLAGLAEPLVGAALLMVFAAGLAGYSFVHEYAWVIALSLVWSMGLHVWMPLPNSMTLALAEPGHSGRRLGQVGAAGSAGFFGGLLTAFVLTNLGVTMRSMYLVAGASATLAAFACLGIYRRIKTPGPRLVFRRKYGLYYLLCFLDGWRKQVFICFAGFLLVKVYHTSLESMLILQGVVQVFGYFAAPRVGRLIDRIGERRVLIAYYLSIMFVFIGYAFIPNVHILYGLFIADGAIWVLAMALTTYVGRIAPKAEHTQTLSMGVAMNHVAAVSMPLLGGLLWQYGYRWTFMIGIVAAIVSVPVVFLMPKHVPAGEVKA
jgi:MFS family permease